MGSTLHNLDTKSKWYEHPPKRPDALGLRVNLTVESHPHNTKPFRHCRWILKTNKVFKTTTSQYFLSNFTNFFCISRSTSTQSQVILLRAFLFQFSCILIVFRVERAQQWLSQYGVLPNFVLTTSIPCRWECIRILL